MISTYSRIRGSLYGVAVVDALGGPVEFRQRGTFPPVNSFRYNNNFDLAPGTWTDDTSMTLCLAQSLVDTKGEFVVQDQVRKYIKWYQEGYMSAIGRCFDIGNATRQALGIWKKTLDKMPDFDPLDPEGHTQGQGQINASLDKEHSCGNGSLMRCVPIPLVYHHNSTLAHQYAALASAPTHPHATCIDACQLYTYLITYIFLSPSITRSKSAMFDALKKHPLTTPPLISTFAKYESLAGLVATPDSEISSSGYVVHTLEASLWAFFTTETFRDGALKVVNLGDDADTVGAVYGGIAGAYYAIDGIPDEWIKRLEAKEMVEEVIEGVVKLVRERGNNGD